MRRRRMKGHRGRSVVASQRRKTSDTITTTSVRMSAVTVVERRQLEPQLEPQLNHHHHHHHDITATKSKTMIVDEIMTVMVVVEVIPTENETTVVVTDMTENHSTSVTEVEVSLTAKVVVTMKMMKLSENASWMK